MKTRILLVLLPAVALAACSSKKPTTACTDPGTQITIDAPADQALLAQDADPDVPGFQVRLQAHTDVADGTLLQFNVNGVPDASQVKVSGGKIDQEVTLVIGANTLSLSHQVCDRSLHAAVSVSVSPNGCLFTNPLDNQTLQDAADTDPTKAGVQLDVTARCAMGAGNGVKLAVNHAQVSTGSLGPDGKVTFAAQSLYPGDVELELLASDDSELATARAHVQLTNGCIVGLDPGPNAMFNLDGEPGDSTLYPQFLGDADPNTPGVQADVHVTSSCAGSTKAHLKDAGGNDLGSAPFVTALTTVRITVPDGPFPLFPVVDTPALIWPGNPILFNGDGKRPSCTITDPADGGAAEDADPGTQAIEFHVTGTCTGLDAGTSVRLVLDDQPVALPDQKLSATLSFDFATSVATAGNHQVQVVGHRPSGNATKDKGNSFVAGLPNCAIVTPADQSASSTQPISVQVKSNVDVGTPIVVSVIDPTGAKADLAPALAVADPSGGTTVTISAPLASGEGRYEIDAKCGTSGEAMPHKVDLDTTAPALVVTVPTTGGVINQSIPDADTTTPAFEIAVTVTADSIQDGSHGTASVSCAPSGFKAGPVALTFATNAGVAAVPLDGAAENDTCTFTATAIDLAGNVATPVVSATATYDRTGPVFLSHVPASLTFSLVVIGNSSIDGVTVLANESRGLTPTLSYQFQITGADGGQFQLVDASDAVVLFDTTVPPGGLISATKVAMQSAQGKTAQIEAQATDLDGNTTTLTYSATVDTAAPDVPLGVKLVITDKRKAGGTLQFPAPSGDLGGTKQTATRYDVRWSADGIATEAGFQAAPQILVAAPQPPGVAESLAVSIPPFGLKVACVRAIDGVGNLGSFACASTNIDWDTVTYTSDQAGTLFGFHIVPVGDVTGDGFGDFVATERGRTTAGVAAGAVELFCGGADLVTALSAPCATLAGSVAGERCGEHLASGDFDGDGITDLAMGCNAFGSNQGRVFLFFGTGKAGGYSSSSMVELHGTTSPLGQFGASLASLGDVDGDGTEDLYVGAHAEGAGGPGSAYVFFGRTQTRWATVASDTQTLSGGPADVSIPNVVHFKGDANGDVFGYRYGAGRVGDLDGDGLTEFAIPESNFNRLFVYNATTATKAMGTVHAADAATKIEDKVNPAPAGGLFAGLGHRFLSGDFTGDGFPDLVVADPFNVRVDLYPGDKTNKAITTTATQTFQEPNFGPGSNFGYDLAVADVNGDGKADLVVGSNGDLTNAIFLYLATGDGGKTPFDGHGSRIVGPNKSIHGTGVVLEDLNNDGHVDLIVGAPFEAPGPTIHVYISP